MKKENPKFMKSVLNLCFWLSLALGWFFLAAAFVVLYG